MVVEGPPRGTVQDRVGARLRGLDPQLLSGQGVARLVDAAAHCGDEGLRRAHAAGQEHGMGVEEVDHARERLAQVGAGGADDGGRLGLGVAGQRQDVRGGLDIRPSALAHLADEACAAGDGLEAAGVSAGARDVAAAVDARVRDIACRTRGPSVDVAVHDDAAADGRASLDGDAVAVRAELRAVLAECGEVRVVVDGNRHAVAAPHVVGDTEAGPPGHARRLRDGSAVDVDRARKADADRMDRGVPRELVEDITHGVERGLGAVREGDRDGTRLTQLAAERVCADAGVAASEVDRQHDPRTLVDAQKPWTPTAA